MILIVIMIMIMIVIMIIMIFLDDCDFGDDNNYIILLISLLCRAACTRKISCNRIKSTDMNFNLSF